MRKVRLFLVFTALFAAMTMQIDAQNNGAAVNIDEEETVDLTDFYNINDEFINDYVQDMLDDGGANLSLLLDAYQQSTGEDQAVIENALEKIAVKVGKTPTLNDNETMGMVLIGYITDQDTNKGIYLLSLYKYFITDEDVHKLADFIDNEAYADMAIRVVAESQVFVEYIDKFVGRGDAEVNHKNAYAYAIGRLKMIEMEDVLVSWLNKADDNLKIEIYKALLRFDNSALMPMIEKGAKKLYKKKDPTIKMAGMELLVAVKGETAMPYLYKALKNKDMDVRRKALDLMTPYATPEVTALVVKKYAKKDAVADIVRWIGMIGDKTQADYVVAQLSSDKDNVVNEAIRTTIMLETPEGINIVKTMFGGKYQPTIKEAMIEAPMDITPILKDVVKGNNQKKLCVLDILKERKCVAMYYNVVEMMHSTNFEVKDAAYKALKNVVVATHGEFLKTTLDSCDEVYVADVQDAVIAALGKASLQQKDFFVQTMKEVKPESIPRFYKVFAALGTKESVDKLVDAYNSDNDKEKAFEALMLMNNPEFASEIKTLADKHDEYSDKLKKHYIKLDSKKRADRDKE